MQSKDERIQQMLTHYLETSQNLMPIEPDNTEIIKKRLKLMRGMSKSFELSLQDIEELNDRDARKIANTYQSLMTNKEPTKPLKRHYTDSFFLHQLPKNYPFTYDIVTTKAPLPVDGIGIKEGKGKTTTPSPSTKEIHGCPLKDEEAFTSSRYYSEDKTQYGRIIARPGQFQIEHQKLNNEQKSDLALETAFQFLLNMKPGAKDITITGNSQMAHKLNAAILFYQQEHGELFNKRFPDLKIHLPEGVGLAANQTKEDYFKTHLGTLQPKPQQSTLLHTFLNQDNTQKNIDKMESMINLNKCINSPDVNEQDKIFLRTYQDTLQDYFANPIRNSLPEFITQEKNFLEQTQKALECIKKSPGLKEEAKAMKVFYDLTVTDHQELVKQSESLDKEYEAQMKPLKEKLNKAHFEMVQAGVKDVSDILKLWIPKDEKDKKDILQCLEQARQLEVRLNQQPPKSEQDHQKLIMDFHKVLHEANRITNQSIPVFTESLKSIEERIAGFPKTTEPKLTKPLDAPLKNHTQTMKEQLGQMKSGTEDKITLSSEQKDELMKKFDHARDLIETSEDLKDKGVCEKLLEVMQQDNELTKTKVGTIVKSIDAILPDIQNHEALKKSLLEIKSTVTDLTSEKMHKPDEGEKLSL